MNYSAYIETHQPLIRSRSLLSDTVLIVAGSIALAISAHIAIPLPFSPVPVTAQTFVVLMLGALFGSVRAGTLVLLYIAEGLAGLPVFFGGGGMIYLMGPTGGYLIGFFFAAVLVGYLAERGWDRRFGTTLAAMTLGTGVIFLFGVSWLALLFQRADALSMGLLPFIPGAVIKIFAAALLLPLAWKYLNRDRRG